MSLHVALTHRTSYAYDRPVTLAPQVVRLRPAPHCRTPILAYSLNITPAAALHQLAAGPVRQLPGARRGARTRRASSASAVDLVADMTVINPFDFFVEEAAEKWPFQYDPVLLSELKPYLEPLGQMPADGPLREGPRRCGQGAPSTSWSDLNRKLSRDISYLIRMEPGVQTPDETLQIAVRLLPRLAPGCWCRCCATWVSPRDSCRAT